MDCKQLSRKDCNESDNCVYYNTKLKNEKGKWIWACKERERAAKRKTTPSIKITTPPEEKKIKLEKVVTEIIKKDITPQKIIETDLESLTIPMLIDLCKRKGIDGYSNKSKSELIKMCSQESLSQKKPSPPKIKDKKSEYEKLSISALKKLCKEKGIKGYTKMNKDELVRKCALNEKVEAYMDVVRISTQIHPSMKTFKTLQSLVAKDPVSFVKFSSHYMYEWGWFLYLYELLPNASFCLPELKAPGGDLQKHYRADSAISFTNTGGISVSKWGYKAILDCLNNNRLAIIVLNLKGRGGQHANALIFDKKNKILTRFEPHGSEVQLRMYDPLLLDASIQKWLDKKKEHFNGWEYKAPIYWCPKKGPQAIESELKSKKKGEISGYCQAWSLMFLHLRILNPDHSDEQIVEHMLGNKNAQEMKKMIRDYAGFIAEHSNPYVKKRQDELFAPGTYVRLTHNRVDRYGKVVVPGKYKTDDNTHGSKYKDQPYVFVVDYPVGWSSKTGVYKWFWDLMVPIKSPEAIEKVDKAFEKWVENPYNIL